MKIIKFFKTLYILPLIAIIFFSGCQNFDEPAFGDYPLDGPMITLINPNPNGSTVIQSSDPVTSVNINFTVTDDIAVASVLVTIDGFEVANLVDFSDPTSVNVEDLVYDNIDTGSHSITVTATDSDNNVDSLTADFIKEDTLPYNPQNGEFLYMPFENNYNNLVSSTPATVVGNPGFADEAKVGESAYAGATDSYLTYPTAGLLGSEFSASFSSPGNTPFFIPAFIFSDNSPCF